MARYFDTIRESFLTDAEKAKNVVQLNIMAKMLKQAK